MKEISIIFFQSKGVDRNILKKANKLLSAFPCLVQGARLIPDFFHVSPRRSLLAGKKKKKKMTKSLSNTTLSVKLNHFQERCYLPIRSSLGRRATSQVCKQVSKSVYEWQRLCKAG